MARRAYPSAKKRILEAAEVVIRREGAKGLSVDAVVGEAGISKGGFFYHFKTKEEMLAALVVALDEEVSGDIAALVAEDPEPHGRLMRALIRCAFGYDADPARRDRFITLILALVTVAGESPEVLAAARRGNDEMLRACASDGLSLAQSLLINSALEGFWLGQALGTVTVPDELRGQLRDLLIALTRAGPGAPGRGEPSGS